MEPSAPTPPEGTESALLLLFNVLPWSEDEDGRSAKAYAHRVLPTPLFKNDSVSYTHLTLPTKRIV